MKSKLKIYLSTLFCLLFGVITLFQVTPIQETQGWDVTKWVMCGAGESGKIALKAARTDWVPFIWASKSTTNSADKPEWNPYNYLLKASGYEVGIPNAETPFDKFGLLGIKFSSYTGEWKYYNVEVCDDGDRQLPVSTNYGMFYEDRKDPLSTYEEINATKDVRTKEYARGRFSAFSKAFFDNFANLVLSLTKFLFVLTMALISVSVSDLSSAIGFGREVQTSMISKFYTGIFLPLVTVMFLMTAGYIFYHGIVKRDFRTAVIGGILKPIICMTLAVILGVNPSLVSLPSKLSVLGQSIVLSSMTNQITNDDSKNALCGVTTENLETNINKDNFLDNQASFMRRVIGCRMYSEFMLKPLVKGQFGSQYKDLESLKNENEKWVKKPDVKLSNKVTQSNWGLFYVSVMSGIHNAIDGIEGPLVGGNHKDYYRIIDALANYEEDTIIDEEAGNGSSMGGGANGGSGDSSGSGGDWLTEGTEANKAAKEIIEFFKERGWSGEGIAGILGNAQGESNFIPDLQEGGGRFGMMNKDHNGHIVTYPMPNERNSPLGGGGLFQFTPYTKYSHGPYFNECGWCAKGQMKYIWEVYGGARTSNGLANTLAKNPRYVSMAAANTDITQATYGWFYLVENGMTFEKFMTAQNQHAPRRIAAAKKAYEHFNLKDIKFDPSKFQSSQSSVPNAVNPSSSSIQNSSSGSRIVPIPKDNPPLKEWESFIGNNQGERIGQSLIMLLFTIIGSILPIFFSLLSSIYGIGITLLSVLAPIFLLFGCWGGKGNQILMQYLGSLSSTFMKRIGATLLLVLSIIMVTNTMSLINEVGLFKAAVFLILISIILYKQRNTILNKLSQSNLGQLGAMQHFSSSLNKIKSGAKHTTQIAAAGVVGGISAKKNNGDFFKGAGGALKQSLKDKMYRTQIGRRATAIYKATNKDPDDIETKNKFCVACGDPIKEDTLAYIDDNGNFYCEMCASARGYNNLSPLQIDNEENNSMAVTRDKSEKMVYSVDSEGNIDSKSTRYLTQEELAKNYDINNLTPEEWQANKDIIQNRITDSMAILYDDINELNRNNNHFRNYFIPEPLRGIISHKDMQKIISNKDTQAYQSTMEEAWKKWYTIQAKYNQDSDEDISKALNDLENKWATIQNRYATDTNREEEEN